MAAADTKRISGTLIVAGLGAVPPFEALLDQLGGRPERLILAEPAETSGGGHAQRFAGMEGVEQIDAILADRGGAAELVCYNLPGLRSTQAPTGALTALFPGLKERARIATRAIPVAQAIGDPAALPAPVRLRIDMPGSEVAILAGMEEAGVLDRVDLLSLRCGAEAMFEGGRDRARLQAWLEERYFRLEHADEADADWPELLLKADPARKRIAALEAELARVHEDAAATAKGLREELEGAKAEAERQAALAEEREAARARAYEDRDKAYSDLALAMRMKGLLQSDLDDLRARYRESEASRVAQEELLRKLTPRLKEAAEQLRWMHLEGAPEPAPELVAPHTPGETAKAKSGTATGVRKRTSRKKTPDGR